MLCNLAELTIIHDIGIIMTINVGKYRNSPADTTGNAMVMKDAMNNPSMVISDRILYIQYIKGQKLHKI